LGFKGDIINDEECMDKIAGLPVALIGGEVTIPRCSSCDRDMVLIVSFLAPLEYINIHERILYLFGCNNSQCNDKQWELLRSQIVRQPEPKESKKEDKVVVTSTQNKIPENDDDWGADDNWGSGADSWVSQSASATDIEALLEARDKTLQTTDTKAAQPKKQQKNQSKKSNKRTGYYIEWEPEGKENYITQKEQKIIAEQQRDYDNSDWQGEEYEVSNDKSWDKFTKVLNKNPAQILRYGVNPVWYQNHSQMEAIDIPSCLYCNSSRTFEFQVMPTIIEILESISISVDFGTIVCFTCSRSCQPTNTQYHKEYIIKQDSL